MGEYDGNDATMAEKVMMAGAMAPVFGAMMSAPVVGTTLIVLSVGDSLMLLLTNGY